MHKKLPLLMKSEGLTSSRLAELLGIQPSGISHLLSGRNKPSYDLLQKILRRFPNINPDWLLLDDEQMYRSSNETTPTENLFDASKSSDQNTNSVASLSSATTSVTDLEQSRGSEIATIFADAKNETNGRKVKRVILLYTDHSFESYELK